MWVFWLIYKYSDGKQSQILNSQWIGMTEKKDQAEENVMYDSSAIFTGTSLNFIKYHIIKRQKNMKWFTTVKRKNQ